MSFPVPGVEVKRNLERSYRAIDLSRSSEERAKGVVGTCGGVISDGFQQHRDLFGAALGREALLG